MNKKKEKMIFYATVDDKEDWDFVREDIAKHNMEIKGWLRIAIKQMRKYRNQQMAGHTVG